MVNVEKKHNFREYKADEIVWFRKTKEAFGGLSNMCAGYQLNVNGHKILTSEALYQACRFPNLPDVQQVIINERSPMTAKMKSKPHRIHTRKDWDNARIAIMRWSLQVKLAQNFIKFGKLLEETNPKQIVEDSRKDKFWGAVREKNDEHTLKGVNALGRLLMELRQKYMSDNRYNLLVVEPLQIENFKLFGEYIHRIDERMNFVNSLINGWGLKSYFSVEQINEFKKKPYPTEKLNNTSEVNEPLYNSNLNGYNKMKKDEENEDEIVTDKIMLILKYGKALSSKDIIKRLRVDWKTNKMTSFLKKLKGVEKVEGTPLKFKINQSIKETNLFSKA